MSPDRPPACLAVLVVSALLLREGVASAQAPPPQTPTFTATVDVEEVRPDDAAATPGAVTVITSDDLLAFRPFTLHDAFVFVPGVQTIDDDILGRRSGIGVRGAPPRRSRKTLLLEDGTPINASTYLDPSAHYTPPLERLERVDVLKGTGHILHGPLNNHGIINFRNKQPTLRPSSAVDISIGNLGTFKRHLMHRRTDGPVGVVAAYTGANTDGTFDVERHQYDDAFGSVDWRLSPSQTLGGSATYFRERSNYDESNLTPQEFAVSPRTKLGRFGQEHNTIAVNLQKYDLVHRGVTPGGITASTKVFATNLDRPRFTVDPGESPIALLPAVSPEDPFLPGVEGRMVSRDRHYQTVGVETRMERAAAGSAHLLQWGGRAERHRLDDRRTRGGVGEVIDAGNRGIDVRDEAYRASAASVFVQDVFRVRDWVVTPGVRVEHYTQSKERRPSLDLPAGEPVERDANTLVLPSVSVLYTRWATTPIFANLGRGYTPAFARTAVDFPLLPETGINSQLGVRTTAIKGTSLEVAAFHNWISDTVVQLPFTIDNQNVFLNSEDSRSYGVDVGARVNSAAFTASAYNWFGAVAWNYMHASFTAGLVEGRRVPEVPRQAGSVTFGIEHRSGWRVNTTVSHFGDFYTDPANVSALTLANEDGEILGPDDDFDLREPVVLGRVPARTLLSASVSAPIPGLGVTAYVQGRNLTNRLYITDLANGLRPGAARTVLAGIRVEF